MSVRDKDWLLPLRLNVREFEDLKKTFGVPATKPLLRQSPTSSNEDVEADRIAKRFAKGVTRLGKIEKGELLVLHVPDRLTEKQFDRISRVMTSSEGGRSIERSTLTTWSTESGR